MQVLFKTMFLLVSLFAICEGFGLFTCREHTCDTITCKPNPKCGKNQILGDGFCKCCKECHTVLSK